MWRLHIAYYIIPSLIGIAAIAAVLIRRSPASSVVWLVGFSVVALLVAGVSWTLYRSFEGQIPLGSLVKAFATIYYSLFVALTGAAFTVRRRIQSRAVGIGVLVGLFLAIGIAATYASTYFFMLVNAEA